MPAGFGRKHTATATTLVQPMRRFPPPWTVEKTPGGFKIIDANGQTLAYVYSRAGVLTEDEARRMASNIAKLPTHLIVLDRILLGFVLMGLMILGGQLIQMQSREAEIERQVGTLARHMATAETRDTAAEDRDRALAQQISAVVQQHTGQLDKMEAALTSLVRAQ